MAKKSFNQKLNEPGDLPKVEDLSDKPEFVARYGGAKMLIAAPLQYNEIISRIPAGKIVTTEAIRKHLALAAGADVTCPMTAGIFINICAKAALEREDGDFPWWRVVKTKGELNEKFPGGIEQQTALLELEGHQIVQRRKKFFVNNYEDKLWVVE